MSLFMSVSYFAMHMFMLTPTLSNFVDEILIEHTPITTILIEHTLIGITQYHG